MRGPLGGAPCEVLGLLPPGMDCTGADCTGAGLEGGAGFEADTGFDTGAGFDVAGFDVGAVSFSPLPQPANATASMIPMPSTRSVRCLRIRILTFVLRKEGVKIALSP